MTEYIFDFEFVEGNPCFPISLGIVRVAPAERRPTQEEQIDDYVCGSMGPRTEIRSWYGEWPDAERLARSSPWLAENVAPHLSPERRFGNVEAIRKSVVWFLGDEPYELLASYGAYDFFLLSQLLGGFQACPKNFPFTFRDLAWMNLPRIETGNFREHHALDDCLIEREALLLSRVVAGWSTS